MQLSDNPVFESLSQPTLSAKRQRGPVHIKLRKIPEKDISVSVFCVPGEIGIVTLPVVQSPEDVGLVGVCG